MTPILTTPGNCVPFWDNQQGAGFPCGAGPNEVFPWTTLTVPAEATPGPHTITVCSPDCGGIDPAWTVSAVFTVSAVVPRLISLPLREARDNIARAGLALGGVQGPSSDPAARVVDQAPSPGTAVDPKSVVSLTVAVPPPQSTLVTVPDLRGRTRAEADALLTDHQLVLRVSSGSGRVDTQKPLPGTQVRPGSVVTVILREAPSTVLVTVPDLRRRTLDQARADVAAVGLALRSRGAPAGTVQIQTPAPGSRVPRGSTVTVTIAAGTAPSTGTAPNTGGPASTRDTSSTPTATTQPTMLIVIAAGLLLAALATLIVRRPWRRSRTWAREHVRVVPGADTGQISTSEIDPGPTHAVGIEPHPDHGSQTLEEVHL